MKIPATDEDWEKARWWTVCNPVLMVVVSWKTWPELWEPASTDMEKAIRGVKRALWLFPIALLFVEGLFAALVLWELYDWMVSR